MAFTQFSYPSGSPGWVSQGGLGASLSVSNVTSNVLVPGSGNAMRIFNYGAQVAFIRIGGSSVAATTACMGIPPATAVDVPLNSPEYADAGNYVAAITASSTTSLQITMIGQVAPGA